jgi:tetratricopeptide (TPR) repeat protein
VKLSIPGFGRLEDFIDWCQSLELREFAAEHPGFLSSLASDESVAPWLKRFMALLEETQGSQPRSMESAIRILTSDAPQDRESVMGVLQANRQQVNLTTEYGEVEVVEPEPERETFGRYQIRRKIAEGGFGAVYEAYDPQLDRPVALKLLKLRTEFERDDFEREARLVARLRHPNIIAIHELGILEDQPYFTMDLIEGRTLRDILNKRGTLPTEEAFKIAATISDALAYAHSHGIIHRDMKPENVFVDDEGRVYVGDFGLAKQLEFGSGKAAVSMVAGTPFYMSPEQANGEMLDGRSDVWALGVMLYEMVCGVPPFDGQTTAEVFKKIWFSEPLAPRKWNTGLDGDAQTIITKCIEKNLARRYASAEHSKADIEKYLHGEPIAAKPVSGLQRLLRRLGRNKGALLGTAAAAVAVIAVSVLLWLRAEARDAERAERLRREKEEEQAQKLRREKEELDAKCTLAAQVLGRAREAFESRQYEKALELASRSITINPQDSSAQEFRITCTRKLDEVKRARESLARGAGEADPEKALGLIGSAVAVLDGDWYSRHQYGLALERAGKTKEAVEELRKAAKLAEEHNDAESRVESLCRVAIILYNRQDFEEADAVAGDVEKLAGGKRSPATLTLKAMMAVSKYEADKALQLAEEALDMDKTNTIALFYKAFALSDLKQFEESIETYSRCIWEFDKVRNAAWLVWCYNNRGRARAMKGDREAAISDFTRAIELEPDSPVAYSNRGNVKSEKGEHDSAIVDYNKAIEIDSNYAGAYLNRGHAKLHKGEIDEAMADYSHVLRLKPDYPPAYHHRGVARRANKDLDGAIEDFSRAVKADPNYAEAYLYRGLTYADKKDYASAIPDYTQAIRLDPGNVRACFNRAIARERTKDHLGAMSDYTETVRLDPKHSAAYNNRGTIRFVMNDLRGAIADFTKAIDADPKDPGPRYNRGKAKMELNDYSGAIEDFDVVTRLSPGDFNGFFDRGLAKVKNGDEEGALKDFTEALRLEPNDARTYNNRGNVKAKLKDYDGAIKDYSKAIELDPSHAHAMVNRAYTKRSKGDLDGAVEDARRALDLEPELWRAWLALSLSYSSKKDRMHCMEALRTLLKLDPKLKDWIRKHEDFGWLSNDAEFKRLTAKGESD